MQGYRKIKIYFSELYFNIFLLKFNKLHINISNYVYFIYETVMGIDYEH